MHYYLSPWVGDGRADPYRPVIGAGAELDGAPWWAIDLRPDPTVLAGRALVACATRPADEAGGRYLGDDLGVDLPALVRTRLANELGLSLAKLDLRRIVVELLTDHGREDGTRWRPLKPLSRRGGHGWEIHLGGLLWRLPVVAGGSVHTESFTGADNLSLQSADVDLTWTNVSASGWSVSSNRGSILGTSTGAVYSRAEHDTAGTDMHAQAVIHTLTDTDAQCGVCARFNAAANTSYMAQRGLNTTDDIAIRKTVAGTRTTLATGTPVTLALPETLRVECEGSTIRAKLGGVQQVSVTDTSITTGTRGGIYGFRPAGGTVTIDDFEFGDLGGATSGALAASAPLPTTAVAGDVIDSGALAAGAPLPTAALAGTVTAGGQLQVSAPPPGASVAGTVTAAGALAAQAPLPVVALTAADVVAGVLSAAAPLPVVALHEVAIAWPPRASEVVLKPVATATVTLL